MTATKSDHALPGGVTTRIPIRALDRMWAGSTSVGAIGPVAMPSREHLVDALYQIASVGPGSRVGLNFAPNRSSWIYDRDRLRDRCEAMVTSIPESADISATITALGADAPPDLPVRLTVGGQILYSTQQHVLGDARLLVAIMTGVLETAASGQVPAWASERAEAHPLRRALVHFFGSDRARVRPLLDERWRSHRAARRVAEPPVEHRAWTPSPVAIYVRGSGAARRELQAWRRREAPQASTSAMIYAAARAALVQAGIEVRRDAVVLYDARQYLPASAASVPGNFVTGLDLDFTDPADPTAISTAISHAAVAGRPLAAMAQGVAQGVLPTGATPETTVPVHPQAWLAYNMLGRPLSVERLSWTVDPDRRVYAARVKPASAQGVSLSFAQVGDGWQCTASFHDTTFDAATIGAAVRLAVSDPISVLQRARGT